MWWSGAVASGRDTDWVMVMAIALGGFNLGKHLVGFTFPVVTSTRVFSTGWILLLVLG